MARSVTGRTGTKQAAQSGAIGAISAEAIARRAYEIYEARGRTDGAQVDDWLRAEAQLSALTVMNAAEPASGPARKSAVRKR
jgi:hypothetical protein